MTIITNRKQIGASPGKLALIGVLAVVLFIVIWVQLPSSSENNSTALPKRGPTAARRGVDLAKLLSAPEEPEEDKPIREWPELSMLDITAYDPLTAPAWYLDAMEVEEVDELDGPPLITEADKESYKTLRALQETGTNIVLISNGERIATIGDRSVRIGDSIGGFEVSDITDQGVVLTRTRSR